MKIFILSALFSFLAGILFCLIGWDKLIFKTMQFPQKQTADYISNLIELTDPIIARGIVQINGTMISLNKDVIVFKDYTGEEHTIFTSEIKTPISYTTSNWGIPIQTEAFKFGTPINMFLDINLDTTSINTLLLNLNKKQ